MFGWLRTKRWGLGEEAEGFGALLGVVVEGGVVSRVGPRSDTNILTNRVGGSRFRHATGSVVSERIKVFSDFFVEVGFVRGSACQVESFDLAGLLLDLERRRQPGRWAWSQVVELMKGG